MEESVLGHVAKIGFTLKIRFEDIRYYGHRVQGYIMGNNDQHREMSTGRIKPVTELSRGTAEQLYLAMRFAFIDEYVEHAEPVPVLMDDVLVNFDDGRSRAASEAIAEFSRTHQVLLLTCHEQTVDGMTEAADAAGVPGPEIIRI